MKPQPLQIFSLPKDVTGTHLQSFGKEILKQLLDPSKKHLDLSKAAISAGLPVNINAEELAQSSVFRLLLETNGLSPDFFAKCLYDDIVKKPQNRFQELKLLAQVLGMMSPLSSLTPSEQANQNTSKSLDLIEKILDHQRHDSKQAPNIIIEATKNPF